MADPICETTASSRTIDGDRRLIFAGAAVARIDTHG